MRQSCGRARIIIATWSTREMRRGGKRLNTRAERAFQSLIWPGGYKIAEKSLLDRKIMNSAYLKYKLLG